MPDDPTSLAPASPSTTAAGPVPKAEQTAPLTPRLGSATFRSLRHRNYRLYFIGQLISLTGSWMQTTALMSLAFDLTGVSAWPARISAAQLLPTFLLGAWGGSLADRWPKRRLLIVTQAILLGLALLLMAVVLGRQPSPWELLAVTAAAGLVQAIDLPARLAFVMDMVGREDVTNAIALNSVLFNSARILGPLLAVTLLYHFEPAVCFLGNALSYLAVICALMSMDVAETAGPPRKYEGFRDLFAGFAELRRRPALLMLVAAAGTTSLCGWPFLSLLPALAKQLTAPDSELAKTAYGTMLSGTGLGALMAALTVARFGTWERRRHFLGLGVGILSSGLVCLSLAGVLPVSFVCCAGAGFGLVLFFSTGQGVLQLSASASNRGRLLGIWAMVLSGSAPFGNLIVGRAADHWGVAPVLRVQGLACGGASLLLVYLYHRWQSETTQLAEEY